MKETRKERGLFEKVPESGVWWIRYADGDGRIRREKVGTRGAALKLYRKRKTQVLQGEKLPENFRAKPVLFSALADATLEWSKAHKISSRDDASRMRRIREEFGSLPAQSITSQEIEKWFTRQTWKPATFNRYKALFSLTYRLGIISGKVEVNPAKTVKTRTENNKRNRFLSKDEETILREQIEARCPDRLPEFELALHTGMRRSEQFGLAWDCVDFEKRILTIARSKHGETRYVFLNDAALAALRVVWRFSDGKGSVFSNGYRSEQTYGAREWFEECIKAASIPNFTWHCLRHTFASNLVMQGVDIRTVQELMGHKTIQMTLRYSHLAPQHQLAAVQRLCDSKAEKTEREAAQNTPTSTRTSTEPFEAKDTPLDCVQ